MTWDSAVDALLQHFKTQWEATNPSVPIHYPNAKALSPATDSAWGRLRFVSSFSDRVVVGGQLRLQGGRVLFSIFTPLGTGDGVASAYARDVESIWESAKANGLDGGIHLGAPLPMRGGPDPDEPFWREGNSTPFRFDHNP